MLPTKYTSLSFTVQVQSESIAIVSNGLKVAANDVIY